MTLAFVMVASSLAEMVSLGAVVPFLSVLSQPERLWGTGKGQWVSQLLGWQQPSDLVVPLCLGFAAAALLAGLVRLVALRSSIGLANAIGSDLSVAVYRHVLYQPYAVHLQRNSSETISAVTNEVTATVGLLNSLLQLCSAGLVSLGLAAVLIWLNPGVTLAVGLVVVGGYGLLIRLSRRRVQQLGLGIIDDQKALIRNLQEGLGAIRDVILLGSQPIYSAAYALIDRRLRRRSGQGYFLAIAPRYGMEAVGLLAIGTAALVMSQSGGGFLGTLPLLGALALGAQRLLPTLQLIYGSWHGCRLNLPALQSLLGYLEQPIAREELTPPPPPLEFEQTVALRGVSFRYAPELPWVLRDVNLTIRRGERLGIVGETGCGKSTLVDLLMGLLEPSEGELLVDGQPVGGARLRRWRSCIAHVPQNIFLSDASIAENIAFGLPSEQIEWEQVQHAAEQAQIAGFIEGLSRGYDSPVGERGVRLSGGQRQRIGIARALYHGAKLLVFDEATSALDSDTEQGVLAAIDALSSQLSIVMIAHRLSSLQSCDRCLQVRQGRLQNIKLEFQEA